MEKIMWFWDKWKKVEKTFNEIAIKVQKREKLSLEQNQALIDAINIVIKKQALTSKDKDAEFAIGVGHLKAAQIKMNTSPLEFTLSAYHSLNPSLDWRNQKLPAAHLDAPRFGY